MTLHIYDAMAVLRRALDTDPLGKGPRKQIINMLAASPRDLHIWVFEGRGAKQVRRKFYSGYKERPSTMTDGFMDVVGLIRDALKHTPAMQVAVEGFEGDDVIAHLCRTYGATGIMPVEVHSVDRDLHQLGVIEGVKIRVSPFKPALPDKYVRLYKTYVGDPSDKVPGLAGFGPKSWEGLNHDLLQVAHAELVRNNPRIESFMAAGMKEATAARVCEKPMAELLRNFWIIVGFLPLPADWADNIVVGKSDKMAADLLLKEHRH